MTTGSRGESPLASQVEAKASETQGRRCEAGSERSVERKPRADEQEAPMRREGWTSGPKVAKSNSTKTRQRRGDGGAVKIGGLTSGDLRGVGITPTWWVVRPAQLCAEVSRVHSSDEGRESRLERRHERAEERARRLPWKARGQTDADNALPESENGDEVTRDRFGASSLHGELSDAWHSFPEPPDADPHVRWCERESPRGPTYFDYARSRSRSVTFRPNYSFEKVHRCDSGPPLSMR